MCRVQFPLNCSPILEDIDISEMAKALWEAPFAVLSHDKFENEDPVFTYANKVCLPSFCSTAQEPLLFLVLRGNMEQVLRAGCIGLV